MGRLIIIIEISQCLSASPIFCRKTKMLLSLLDITEILMCHFCAWLLFSLFCHLTHEPISVEYIICQSGCVQSCFTVFRNLCHINKPTYMILHCWARFTWLKYGNGDGKFDEGVCWREWEVIMKCIHGVLVWKMKPAFKECFSKNCMYPLLQNLSDPVIINIHIRDIYLKLFLKRSRSRLLFFQFVPANSTRIPEKQKYHCFYIISDHPFILKLD